MTAFSICLIDDVMPARHQDGFKSGVPSCPLTQLLHFPCHAGQLPQDQCFSQENLGDLLEWSPELVYDQFVRDCQLRVVCSACARRLGRAACLVAIEGNGSKEGTACMIRDECCLVGSRGTGSPVICYCTCGAHVIGEVWGDKVVKLYPGQYTLSLPP